jgi:flagellar biosynthesis/type III secretory pathway ATPase
MLVADGAAWGALGGAAIEAYDMFRAIRATGSFPWGYKDKPPYTAATWVISAILRIGIGAVVAAAAVAGGQVAGVYAAFGLGATGPVALGRLLKNQNRSGKKK